jgi:hypothetical protein
MNGLADVATARFCFVPVAAGQELRGEVFPEPRSGLAFGKSIVLTELRGVDLATTDVHPYAVFDDVVADAGDDAGREPCSTTLARADDGMIGDGSAGGPLAIELPTIPAGTLIEGRSYLGVAIGCARKWLFRDGDAGADASDANGDGDVADSGDDAGGASRDAAPDVTSPPVRAKVCGSMSAEPNAGLVLVRMSRREVGGAFGFQAVHASAPVAGARIAMERAGGTSPVFSADIAPFQIAPRDGLGAVAIDDFGATIGSAALRALSPGGAFRDLTTTLGAAFAASDIDEQELTLGERFSLVLVGAEPGEEVPPPWNGARIAVVRNAPSAGSD